MACVGGVEVEKFLRERDFFLWLDVGLISVGESSELVNSKRLSLGFRCTKMFL